MFKSWNIFQFFISTSFHMEFFHVQYFIFLIQYYHMGIYYSHFNIKRYNLNPFQILYPGNPVQWYCMKYILKYRFLSFDNCQTEKDVCWTTKVAFQTRQPNTLPTKIQNAIKKSYTVQYKFIPFQCTLTYQQHCLPDRPKSRSLSSNVAHSLFKQNTEWWGYVLRVELLTKFSAIDLYTFKVRACLQS